MALKAPLRSSTGNLHFPFGNQGDISASSLGAVSSSPPATDSSMSAPSPTGRIPSNSINMMSPTDIVGPSPVTSNGTEITEIEDDVSDEIEQGHDGELSRPPELLILTTNLPKTVRQSNTDETVSVIHAPESFASWTSTSSTAQQSPPSERASSKGNEEEALAGVNKPLQKAALHPPRPLISTDVKPVIHNLSSATPRAQDWQDMWSDGSRLRSSSTSSLEKIDEQAEAERDDDEENEYSGAPSSQPADDEMTALRTALQECWTLCHTLANLSAPHRTHIFYGSGTRDGHEKAWKTCWNLCQHLYDNQDEGPASLSVRMNLDLCRDFCQALFDIRQKNDEAADSVLRVSFELNNHLYSAQDSKTLPELFRERTLDFYITLCHRLMKQRSELAQETDHLLRACWTLAEVLFNLGQNKREEELLLDGELLGSAIQACWDLCDIFRAGWAQMRPDRRNTPRANQTSFFPQPAVDQLGRESRQSNRSSHLSKHESVKNSHAEERPRKPPPPVPETPVTEFEDTPISPDSRSAQMPNIMVLGTSADSGPGARLSSNASNMTSYSRGSNRTSSSTATTTTAAATEDMDLWRAKVLAVRAAMNMGFDRDTMTDPKTEPAMLQKFVQGLQAGSFGSRASDATLLLYKTSILTNALLPRHHSLPARGKRVVAQDMAKSIVALSDSAPRHAFLLDVFRIVFQFTVEEAETRRNVSIVV